MKREKLWKTFHKLRLNKLSKMWQQLLHDIEIKLSPLVYQSINQKLYSNIIDYHLGTELDAKCENSASGVVALTVDEENIIRYAAGYVPFKLLLQYEKSKAEESVNVIDCLSGMGVNGEESDAMEYTSKWIELVNRGGAFEINDTTYLFFKEIELKVCKELLLAFERTSVSSQRELIISSVAGDESVQFYWTILSVDIRNESQAVKLLKEIIGLWVNIHGFSIAGCWLTKFTKTSSSKKKALRKELKKKTTASSTSKDTE